MSQYEKIHEARYADSRYNFHVAKDGDTLRVELTYPPREHDRNDFNKVRFLYFDQESVRASDGIRIHYDYTRDGFVICKPRSYYVKLKDKSYDTVEEWIEVGFFQSWKFEEDQDKLFKAADEAFEKVQSK